MCRETNSLTSYQQIPRASNEIDPTVKKMATDKVRDKSKKGRQTALNRCKSFLGLKTDNTGYEWSIQEATNTCKDTSPECPFVLKSTNENAKQRKRTKRSKSMDISRIHLLRDPSKNDQSLCIQKNSYNNWNKLEYVKKWQKIF